MCCFGYSSVFRTRTVDICWKGPVFRVKHGNISPSGEVVIAKVRLFGGWRKRKENNSKYWVHTTALSLDCCAVVSYHTTSCPQSGVLVSLCGLHYMTGWQPSFHPWPGSRQCTELSYHRDAAARRNYLHSQVWTVYSVGATITVFCVEIDTCAQSPPKVSPNCVLHSHWLLLLSIVANSFQIFSLPDIWEVSGTHRWASRLAFLNSSNWDLWVLSHRQSASDLVLSCGSSLNLPGT